MAIVRELRQGCRSLLRAPGFSCVVLATFALGIGGSTAIFSLVRGVLLRALPLPREAQLAMVWETTPGAASGMSGLRFPCATNASHSSNPTRDSRV
jgi:hypothetical protein